jgi:hypothetical protein
MSESDADARAAARPIASGVDPVKAVEHAALLGGFDADAGVADLLGTPRS